MYDVCLVPKFDYDFEFYDISGLQSGPLSWITIDPSTFEISVSPTEQEYIDYDDSLMTVIIKAID